jgi:hypothetical protein
MQEDTNQSVAYVRALKRSDAPVAAATAPSPTPEARSDASTSEQFHGAERRRSPRYKCEGNAELLKAGSDVSTWATFADVSLHGCYVESQATYPVDMLLHMKLESNGFRIEANGTVRVNYPYLGMGIAFTEMSEPNRTQLKGLLSTLSRPTVIMEPARGGSQTSSGPFVEATPIADPVSALRALTEFFQSRQLLMRDDFFRILRKSQNPPTLP